MKKSLLLFLILIGISSLNAQTLFTSGIYEQDSLRKDTPCSTCSHWSWSRDSTALYRYLTGKGEWTKVWDTTYADRVTPQQLIDSLELLRIEIEEIASDTFLAYSDVLYVHPNGNNSTAELGQINLPWADPWAAVQVAKAGQIVHILSGDFSIGDIGSGANFEHDGSGTTYSLWKNGVTIFAERGVILRNISDVSDNYLFTPDLSGSETKTKLLGHANIISRKHVFNGASTAKGTKFNAEIQVDTVINTNSARFIVLNPVEDIRVEVSSHYADNPAFQYWFRGSLYANDTFPSNIDIAVDYVRIDSTVNSGGGGDFGVFNANRDFWDSKVNYDIGNMYIVSSGWKSIFLVGGYAIKQYNTTVNLTIENLEYRDYYLIKGDYSQYNFSGTGIPYDPNNPTTSDKMNTLFPMYYDNATVSDNNQYNFSIGNFTGDASVTGYLRQKPTNTNVKVNIHVGNAVSPNGHPLVGAGSAQSSADTSFLVNVHFDNATTINGPAGFFTGSVARLNIGGNYESTGPYPVFLHKGGTSELLFKDVTVSAQDGQAAIEAQNPVTLKVAGVFDMKGIVEDSNVTLERLPEYGATTSESSSSSPTAGIGFTVSNMQIKKEDNMVCLSGHIGATADDTAITSGTTVIATLPSGYRPGSFVWQPAITLQIGDDLTKMFSWQIEDDGEMKVIFLGGASFDLDSAELLYVSGCFTVN